MLQLGRSFAENAKPGDTFGLIGELGTGKTQWTRGFMDIIHPTARTSSPTFGFVNEYRGGLFTVFHFDFYRLKSASELLSIGWDDYLEEPAIIICEWASLFPHLLPENTLWLKFEHLTGDRRRLTQSPQPPPQP